MLATSESVHVRWRDSTSVDEIGFSIYESDAFPDGNVDRPDGRSDNRARMSASEWFDCKVYLIHGKGEPFLSDLQSGQ